MFDHAAHALPVGTEGGDEGCEDDDAGFHEQLGDFAHAADVFDAVFVGEAQVAAQAVAHVITVQYESAASHLVQFFFDRMGEGGFSSAGKPGEPEDGAAMVVLLFAPGTGDGGVVPDDVAGNWGLCGHVSWFGLVWFVDYIAPLPFQGRGDAAGLPYSSPISGRGEGFREADVAGSGDGYLFRGKVQGSRLTL